MHLVGDTPFSPFGDKECEDYLELLSASNFPFDIKYHDELSADDILGNNAIRYSTIILALPAKLLADDHVNIIQELSYRYGISIIASYNRIDKRLKHIFGIDQINGTKFGFPCAVTIQRDYFRDKKIEEEIRLGVGFKIQFQKWGFRRQPLRYLRRHLKKFWQQVFTYQKVEALPATVVLANIKGKTDPAICKFKFGQATNYYIALHSDYFLDRYNSLHRIIRECIRGNSGWGMVECSMDNAMVLRMDDPGTSQRIYVKGYDTKILGQEEWQKIINILKRYQAHVSVMYIPLWVDDACQDKGTLSLKGQEVTNRLRGGTYYSKDVVYTKNNGSNESIVYDYTTEFAALKAGLESGWLDIESHGLTHLDTRTEAWLTAEDRYTNWCWWHEFRHVLDNRDCTTVEQQYVLRNSVRLIEDFFSISPSAVTPSGHEQSVNSEQIAHDCGFKLFSSEYTSVKKNNLVVRNDKLQSVFLASVVPDPAYSHAGYPIIGVFHDNEIATLGTSWLEQTLNDWAKIGYDRFITLRELAGYLCASIAACSMHDSLSITIDISRAGNVRNTPGSAYFSQHQMAIDITLPKGKQLNALFVDKVPWHDFHSHDTEGRLTVNLPIFHDRSRQEVIVALK